jgi:hypothetical protein
MVILKFPLTSEVTEFLVFVSVTVANATGPASSRTCPVIFLEFWPNANAQNSISTASSDANLLMVSLFN